jgi:hypothetical protein
MKKLFVLVLLISFISVACTTTNRRVPNVNCQQQQNCSATASKPKRHFEYREFARIGIYVVATGLALIMPFVGMRIGNEIASK